MMAIQYQEMVVDNIVLSKLIMYVLQRVIVLALVSPHPYVVILLNKQMNNVIMGLVLDVKIVP